ncbi:hypothetical protein BO82DRAFT_346685 [Aspergillus uvarum CBS 121591]|uniref:BTB domain-containing protein n=1 Tax=Aspergillus uvarum CBS 121591 TaxID=1448315 RepID=A0A319BYG9_9EURO|nr:hypothetical protein BO82DRAFT_346685 [Aspergillus uvarum CBS 121591]PYH76649.1 hypothetical protein BO82DRAFT_346685 [Aspergillus uvarum CBS 121591]
MAADFESLRLLLSRIRKYGAYSDLTVLCESFTFRVHRCIVCPQSRFFDKAISGQFQEASTGHVTLEDDPRIVAKMIDYLYCADYEDSYEYPIEELVQGTLEPPKSEEQQNEISTIDEIAESAESAESAENNIAAAASVLVKQRRALINAEIYVIADKYQIEGLKTLAKQKMESCLQLNWTDTDFINTTQYVYGPNIPSHSEIRDILSRYSIQHLSTLEHQQRFHDILKSLAPFSYDFSFLMIKKVLQLEQELW